MEEQQRQLAKKIEALETEREVLLNKHKRDKEQLEGELEEKRHLVKRYENEFREVSSSKVGMKKQLEEYESKIKQLLREIEEKSKKHIREIAELHDQYLPYKNSAIELESRIKHYKNDYDKSVKSEREARKELVRVNLENDELKEKVRYIEGKYNNLIRRLGASQEEIEAVEEELMRQ